MLLNSFSSSAHFWISKFWTENVKYKMDGYYKKKCNVTSKQNYANSSWGVGQPPSYTMLCCEWVKILDKCHPKIAITTFFLKEINV